MKTAGYAKTQRALRAAAGKCLHCRHPARPGLRLCADCAARHSKKLGPYLRKRAGERLAKGLCLRCRNSAEPGYQHCAPCVLKLRAARWTKYWREKRETEAQLEEVEEARVAKGGRGVRNPDRRRQ